MGETPSSLFSQTLYSIMKITPQPEHKNTTSLRIHKHKQINKQTANWVVTWLGQGGAEWVHRLGTGQPAVPRPAVLAFHRFTHSYRWKRIMFYWGQNKQHILHKIYNSIIIELHYHFQMFSFIACRFLSLILRLCSYYCVNRSNLEMKVMAFETIS